MPQLQSINRSAVVAILRQGGANASGKTSSKCAVSHSGHSSSGACSVEEIRRFPRRPIASFTLITTTLSLCPHQKMSRQPAGRAAIMKLGMNRISSIVRFMTTKQRNYPTEQFPSPFCLELPPSRLQVHLLKFSASGLDFSYFNLGFTIFFGLQGAPYYKPHHYLQ